MSDIEALAVSEIKTAVALSDFLKADIKEGDKYPSFDGEILIQPEGDSKKGLEIVKVQVKGHEVKSIEELDREKISFQADVTDLENYARNGGVVFFCVLICGTSRRAYYNSLLPVKLKGLLKDAEGQMTKAIELIPVPQDVRELEEILINHRRDSVNQYSFWSAELPDADLMDIPPGVSYTARYVSRASSEYEAMRHILGKDLYLYMESDSSPVPIPTNTTLQIASMGKQVSKPVSVDGTVFFDEFFARMTEDERTITIGDVTLSYPPEGENRPAKLNLALKGTFRQRLRSLRFVKAMVLNGGYEIGGDHFEVVTGDEGKRFISGNFAQTCSFYEDIASVLDAFNDDADFEIGTIEEEDVKAIGMLKRGLVERQRIRLTDIGYERAVSGVFFFGRHYLLYRETGEDGLSTIRDYVNFDTNMAMKSGEDGEMMRVAKYAFARPVEYFDVANLNARMLTEACKVAEYNDMNCEVSNNIGLALLGRSDDMGNAEDLEAAREIFDWLSDDSNESKSIVYEINLLQTLARSGTLSPSDKKRAKAIIDEDKTTPPTHRELTAACWAILGDRKHAESTFRRLNKESRGRLESYPIINLINGTARCKSQA